MIPRCRATSVAPVTYSVESVWQAERVWFGMRTPVGRTAFREGACAVKLNYRAYTNIEMWRPASDLEGLSGGSQKPINN